METSTSQVKRGMQWIACMKLDGSEFADQLLPLFYLHQQMRINTISVTDASTIVGSKVHNGKNNIFKYSFKH
ncbi:unnamed protein product [Schistosoma margrebowiei]|uniref:Uncharacterized protein n=1 Tax=Schistosoma margrebowiei TaxID=48269 RepID=A0A183M3S8_9TREM|nr:unnamed protein product [Schistosoma margrebowiei]